MARIKNTWAVAALFLFTGCSIHGGNVGRNTNTKITLGGKNFKVVGSVSGMAKGEYILGIGPSEKKLFEDAYKSMIEKSDLKFKSKTVINVTTDVKRISLLLWSEKKVYVSGEVIEFTAPARNKLAWSNKAEKNGAVDKAKYEQALSELEEAKKSAKAAKQGMARVKKEQLFTEKELFSAQKAKNKAIREMKNAILERNNALKQRDACIEERDKALRLSNETALKLSKLGNVKREKRGLVVELSDILFEFAKSRLTPKSKMKLKKIVKILQGVPDRKLVIEGHTDNVGGEKFNKLLSEYRSNAVMEFLTENGINKSRITAKGFGMERPVASNKTAEGRQKNRRVNIVILD